MRRRIDPVVLMATIATFGDILVQWGPETPTVEQGAALKGCLP